MLAWHVMHFLLLNSQTSLVCFYSLQATTQVTESQPAAKLWQHVTQLNCNVLYVSSITCSSSLCYRKCFLGEKKRCSVSASDISQSSSCLCAKAEADYVLLRSLLTKLNYLISCRVNWWQWVRRPAASSHCVWSVTFVTVMERKS